MKKEFSVIIITYKRDDDLIQAVSSAFESLGDSLGEVIVVDNNEDDVPRYSLFKEDKVRVIKARQNLGVAGGRNFGAEHALFPYLIFFDDDAIFDPCFRLTEILDNLDRHTMLAANVYRADSPPAREEFPFFFKSRPRDEIQSTSRFIGVAHVCSMDMFFRFGGYDESSFYGMEEFHFSAWILANGGSIKYLPGFKVIHKKSEKGREDWNKQSLRMFKNKLLFIRCWYFFPFSFLLCVVNYFFFSSLGLSSKDGLRILFSFLFKRVKSDASVRVKAKFLIKQIINREPLI